MSGNHLLHEAMFEYAVMQLLLC